MVLESIKVEWLEQRPVLAFFIGAIYTLIGFGVAYFFFPGAVSIPMLFLTTLLIMPSVIKLLSVEEARERRSGSAHFITNHRDVFEICIFLFLGIFLTYTAIALAIPHDQFESVFSYQLTFLKHQEGLSSELIQNFLSRPLNQSFDQFLSLLSINLKVTLIFFILSFFYGAGAIFLIILNASIFASFASYLIKYLGQTFANGATILGIFSIHLLPEAGGFLLAAIAGGVVSKALLQERFLSKGFKNVMWDAAALLVFSCVLIILAAYLETYATTTLFYSRFQ